MSNICLVDKMNLCFIVFNIAKRIAREEQGREISRDDIGLYFHLFVGKLSGIFSVYENVIICNEGFKSLEWRRSIFSDYKRNRDASKGEEEYKVFKEFLSKTESLIKMFPSKNIKVDEAEADDIIYVLAKKYSEEGNEVVVVSTDGDFKQLMNYLTNVKVYNPIKQKFVEANKYIIEEKSIVGDPSDNISGIPRIGKKTLEKMLLDEDLFKEKMKGDNAKIFETFKKIVDLRNFPEEYQQKVLDIESKTCYNKFEFDDIENFLFNNKLKDCLMSWSKNKEEILKKQRKQNV